MVDQEDYDRYIMQKDIGQQSINADNVKYAPQIQEKMQENQAILVEQVNPKKVVKDVVHALRNEEVNEQGDIVSNGDPMMNELGINRMKFILRGVLNQSTTLSHLDDKDISKIMVRLADDVTDDLTLNWSKYEVKDKIFLDNIVNIVSFNCFFALKRALGMNEKNWLGRISVENITNNPKVQPPSKKGILDHFKL